MLVIHDGMSVVRARLERDLSRFSLRAWLLEMDASANTHIFCWDGVNNKALRQQFYPPYKTNRKPADSSIYEGINFFRDAMKHTKIAQINVPGYEADDVIAAVVTMAAGGGPIHIETRDGDLRQLCALSDDIKCTANPVENLSDADVRLYKTWVGDTSDKISGVKGFGEKAWALCQTEDLLAIVLADELTDAMLECLPKDAHRNWVRENHAELKAMWKIVGFFPIEKAVINQHLVIGKSDIKALDAKLREFFL